MPSAFEEDQQRFIAAFALADLFESYDYRCAFTGLSLKRDVDLDPIRALLRLIPQTEVRADCVIPATAEAQAAYKAGGLAVAGDYSLLLLPSALPDPAIIAALNRDHRLRLPRNTHFRPNMLVLREQASTLLRTPY